MPEDPRLTPHHLHRLCDPSTLGFGTTGELETSDTFVLGQDDAVSALSFGLSLADPGYNIFLLGDMISQVVDELRRAIPDALDSDEVSDRRAALIEEHGKRASSLMEGVRKELEEDPWVALVGPPGAMTVVGARGGEPLSQNAYEALSGEDRGRVDDHVLHATGRVFDTQRRIHQVQQEARDEVAAFHREVARQIVAVRMESVRERFGSIESVLEHIDRMVDDMIRNVDMFIDAGRRQPLTPA